MISQKFVAVSKAIRRYEKRQVRRVEGVGQQARDGLPQAAHLPRGGQGQDHRQLRRAARRADPRVQVPRPDGLRRARDGAQRDAAGGQVPRVRRVAQRDARRVLVGPRLALAGRDGAAARPHRRAARRPVRGFELLNWNSLSIPEFTDSCLQGDQQLPDDRQADPEERVDRQGVVDAIASVELLKPSARRRPRCPRWPSCTTRSRSTASRSSRSSSASTRRSARC